MLSDICTFVRERQRVSLYELALHFDTDEGLLEGMMQHWLRKGRIKQLITPPCQTACGGCDAGARAGVLYCWVKQRAAQSMAISCCTAAS